MIPQTLSQARKMIDALRAKLIKPAEITILNMSAEHCLEIAGDAKKKGKSVLDALVAEYKREQDLLERNGQAPSASACTPTATVLPTAARPATPARPPAESTEQRFARLRRERDAEKARTATPAPTPPATTSATATGPLARELAVALLDEKARRDAAALVKTRGDLDRMTPAAITAFFKNGGTLVS